MMDPVLLAFYNDQDDCFWDCAGEPSPVEPPFVRAFLRDARANDAGERGCAFFLRLGRKGSFAFTLTSDEPEAQFRARVEDRRREIAATFSCIKEAICGVEDKIEGLSTLTDDEMMLLRLLTSGVEPAEIEAKVNFERSFASILAGLQRKLGARNLPQAIYRFAELRTKEFFPPTGLEVKSFGG